MLHIWDVNRRLNCPDKDRKICMNKPVLLRQALEVMDEGDHIYANIIANKPENFPFWVGMLYKYRVCGTIPPGNKRLWMVRAMIWDKAYNEAVKELQRRSDRVM